MRARLEEFYRRLSASEPCLNAEEALLRICRTLDDVEDELSGGARKMPPPVPGRTDGRMYPPEPDFTARREDGSITAVTKNHYIEISAAGGIVITNRRTNKIDFETP